MGRVTEDIAAIAGGSPIDDAINRIMVTYDDFGRPSVIESLNGTGLLPKI